MPRLTAWEVLRSGSDAPLREVAKAAERAELEPRDAGLLRRLVGTEIAHAVPLTLVAGLGHAGMGNMDWTILAYLLMGSLPGIYFGSHLSGRVSDEVLRPCLAIMLAAIGYKLI